LFTRKNLVDGIITPKYEIYLSKEENKYLTYDVEEEKWKIAKIDYLNNEEYTSFYAVGRYYSKDTEKTIVEHLNNEKKTPYEAIFNFQSQIKEDNLKKEHKKITDRIDSAMELVPELPKDFQKWIEETAMIHSRYIYYNYSRNVTEGYCTHCGQMVPVFEAKNNTTGTCKNCKSKITYKAIKKSGTIKDEGYASILQKTKEGFVLRYFEIRKSYENYQKPKICTEERVRVIYDKGFHEIDTYEHTEFRNTRVYRWCFWSEKNYSYSNYRSQSTYVHPSTVYDKNLKKTLEETEHQYSAIELFTKGLKGERFYLAEYLNAYSKHKYIEYLVKLKLYRIVKDDLRGYGKKEINEYGKRPHEVLKIKKEQVKILCEMNATSDELRVLQKANTAGVKITKEQIRWIAENIGRSDLIGYMKYSTVHKVIRYLKENAKKMKIESLSQDYCDYLECSEKLGYDLENSFVFFPKHLKEVHDQVTAEWQQKKDKIKSMQEPERNIEMEIIAAELVEKYAMNDKHFCIRIPWTCEEIKTEGHTLHHCVGTYVDKVLRKETTILFIRKIDDVKTPFYTMEVKNREIVQVRGKHNCDMTPEVKAFTEKFKIKVLEYNLERMAG